MMADAGSFDVIIIGAGLAGLTCGASLGKAGRKVLLLEKNRRPGGYAVSLTRRDHRFDIAVQNIGGCGRRGMVTTILSELGVADRVQFLACRPARVYDMTGVDGNACRWVQEGSMAEQIAALCSQAPGHRATIETCHRVFTGIMEELMTLGMRDSATPPFGFTRDFPLLARYGGATLREFMDAMDMPGHLQQLLTARHGYCMLPVDELSLVGFACTEAAYGEGAWMVSGGVEQLTSVLNAAHAAGGGVLRCGRHVSGITTDNGRVTGVRLAGGERYRAPTVVAAAAARELMQQVEGYSEHFPLRYRRRLENMVPSGSYYIAFYSIPASSAKGLFPNMEIRERVVMGSHHEAGNVYYILVPSLVDSGAAPAGKHCLCLSMPCPPGDLPDGERRKTCRQAIEAAVSRRFPKLDGSMELLFEMGPFQLEAMTANPGGAAYGWALLPGQSGIRRLGMRTPLAGLFLAGHWTMPGGGIPGVMTSGRLCARAILAK